MKTILVATDFSVTARNAANYAADMAFALGANLVLFHSYQTPVAYLETPVTVNDTYLMDTAKADIADLKKHLLERINNKVNIETIIKSGDFFNELQTTCEKLDPYVVMMGSQGKTAAERILFGGHAVYSMQHLKYPLITVPIEASFEEITKIALASDFDHATDKMNIEEIKRLLKDFDAELHIINTGENDKFDAEVVFESVSLQELLKDENVKFHFITNRDTDDGILHFAETNEIDLLIVLPKKHSLLDKLMHRSHTKKLVLHSHVPVMALHL